MSGAQLGSCEMCAWEMRYTRATQEITFGAGRYAVCEHHASHPVTDPRTKVVDFKTEDNHYGSETSAKAASHAAESAKLNDTHRRILGQLCIQPDTPDGIAILLRLNWSTARARMTDLKNAGYIVATGETRQADGGKQANVMRPTLPSEREQERAA